ncbi:MAG: hypothetical protein FWH40_07635 [Coriobacteriia bacterium]|nr:hypothetical protein [Coriobacteriia bacterium]
MANHYLLSDLDIAFICVMFASHLPRTTPDPFVGQDLAQLDQWREEFLQRQQQAGNLTVENDSIELESTFARALRPFIDGAFAIYHTDPSTTRLTEYDAAFYVTTDEEAMLIQREAPNANHIIHYPTLSQCAPDFLSGFSLDKTEGVPFGPFKVLGDISTINALFELVEANDSVSLADCAADYGIACDQLIEALDLIMDPIAAIVIDVVRNERIKSGGIKAKLLLDKQIMLRYISTPDGDIGVIESYSPDRLLSQMLDFEGM